MDTETTLAGLSGLDKPSPASTDRTSHDRLESETVPTALAYVGDADTTGVVRRSLADLGFTAEVRQGSIGTAIDDLARSDWPRFLIVDVSGLDDPMRSIRRLADISEPETDVVVIGERNDVALYRELRAAGVAEYFYKPLVGSLLTRVLAEIRGGSGTPRPSHGGKLIFVLGVRGGVGATTIATNLSWHIAEEMQRSVLLVDLDLRTGDTALQLDAKPNHALREALDEPSRIDELFLERGVVAVTKRLGLLSGLEPLSDRLVPNEEAILQLLEKLRVHYRYVFVDLPVDLALAVPSLLHMPATVLLVSNGSIAAIRDVDRWREFIGENTPERTLLHILNKDHEDGTLPDAEMLRVVPAPDCRIDWDRDVLGASALGTKTVQQISAIRAGMAQLSSKLAGAPIEDHHGFWHWMFG